MGTPLLPPPLSHVRAFVFDLDGTLYADGTPIDGAAEAVRTLRENGIPVRFLTNTTSQSRQAVTEKLQDLGFGAEAGEVYSPGAVAGAFLRERQATAHLLVLDAALPDFHGVRRDEESPDYVVVGDLGGGWTFDRLNRAFRLVREAGARLIGLGRTRYWQTPGGLQLDAGPFITALEYATGADALILGKPSPDYFRAVLDDLGTAPEHTALVGDDVETDVGAAIQAGFVGVQVRTGKFREGDLDGDAKPDLVVDSVAGVLA